MGEEIEDDLKVYVLQLKDLCFWDAFAALWI